MCEKPTCCNVGMQTKAYSQKRRSVSFEKFSLPNVKFDKKARHKRKEGNVAAEVDDLVMFDKRPTIIDQASEAEERETLMKR